MNTDVGSGGETYRSSFEEGMSLSQAQEAACLYWEVWMVSMVSLVCGEGQQPIRTSSAKSNRMSSL